MNILTNFEKYLSQEKCISPEIFSTSPLLENNTEKQLKLFKNYDLNSFGDSDIPLFVAKNKYNKLYFENESQKSINKRSIKA